MWITTKNDEGEGVRFAVAAVDYFQAKPEELQGTLVFIHGREKPLSVKITMLEIRQKMHNAGIST